MWLWESTMAGTIVAPPASMMVVSGPGLGSSPVPPIQTMVRSSTIMLIPNCRLGERASVRAA
jgi:hypothetical protein